MEDLDFLQRAGQCGTTGNISLEKNYYQNVTSYATKSYPLCIYIGVDFFDFNHLQVFF